MVGSTAKNRLTVVIYIQSKRMVIEAEIQTRGDKFPLIDHRRDRIMVTMK